MRHVVEIGCTRMMNLHHFVSEADRIQIFEPMPEHVAHIRETYKHNPKVEIHQVALWKEDCKLKMYWLGETSFAESIQSPVVSNFGYEPKPEHELFVEAKTFDQFDDGTIDIIDIDMEGAEWYVIQRMVSRPQIIVVETTWKNYRNPFLGEIEDWMSRNRYAQIAKQEANTFYKRFGT